MKNTAFRNSFYGGLLMIAIIIVLIISVVYNISIYVKPKVNNLFDIERKNHIDSSGIIIQTMTVDSLNTKFEVIERPVKKDEIIPIKKVTEIKPPIIKTIKPDTIVGTKVINNPKMIIDTTS